MRSRRSTMTRRRVSLSDESGAVSVLTAILVLFVISALAILAIDGGELFMQRRQIVKATDAGTIAAAQWCAQSVGTAQTDTITTRADQTATANISSATRTAGLDFSNGPTSPGQPPSQWGWSASQCNGGGTAGYVRATYGVSATQAFHLGGNRLVHATAIAQWIGRFALRARAIVSSSHVDQSPCRPSSVRPSASRHARA